MDAICFWTHQLSHPHVIVSLVPVSNCDSTQTQTQNKSIQYQSHLTRFCRHHPTRQKRWSSSVEQTRSTTAQVIQCGYANTGTLRGLVDKEEVTGQGGTTRALNVGPGFLFRCLHLNG